MQLLMPGGIEARDLHDRGHQAQQPQCVGLPLFRCLLRPDELLRPPELGFDLLDELADLGRRRFRLCALDANEPGCMIPVRGPYIHHAAGKQGNPDGEDEEGHVFAKQLTPNSRHAHDFRPAGGIAHGTANVAAHVIAFARAGRGRSRDGIIGIRFPAPDLV